MDKKLILKDFKNFLTQEFYENEELALGYGLTGCINLDTGEGCSEETSYAEVEVMSGGLYYFPHLDSYYFSGETVHGNPIGKTTFYLSQEELRLIPRWLLRRLKNVALTKKYDPIKFPGTGLTFPKAN